MARHVETRSSQEKRIGKLLVEEIGAEVADIKPAKVDQEYINPSTVQLLYTIVMRRNFGMSYPTYTEERLVASSDGYVRNGEGGTELVFCPRRTDDCRNALIAVFNKLPGTEEMKRVHATHLTLTNESNKLKQKLEDFQLMGLIPGRCRICNRMSL